MVLLDCLLFDDNMFGIPFPGLVMIILGGGGGGTFLCGDGEGLGEELGL